MNFNDMDLRPEILKAISLMGFEKPTDVQVKTIPYILENNKDLVALAQTGTGKTAAFGLPIINQVQLENDQIQSLILCPTRELCMQIARDFQSFSKYIEGFKVVPVYGGTSIDNQIRSIKKRPQIIVGTPGRSLDLIKRKVLKLGSVKWFVLDEADEMLNMGFKEDLDAIFQEMPKIKHTFLFSATMSQEIARMGKLYMQDTEEISVGKKNSGSDNVEHYYYMTHARDRYLGLKRIVDVNTDIYSIVFCRTRRETQEVAEKLVADGYDADSLHGDLSQAQRDYVMNKFRRRHLQILVATDVAARGLDVNDLTHVINFSLPDDIESYTHRSGRTGRAGKKGISMAIINMREMHRVRAIERSINKKFTSKMIPNGKEICEAQLFKLIDKIKNIEINHEQIDQYLPMIFEKFENLDREELIKHLVSMEFNRFLDYYKNAKDLNTTVRESRPYEQGSNPRARQGMTRQGFSRIFVNKGEVDNMNPGYLMGMINDAMGSKRIKVGKIDIKDKFSFVEVESESVGEVIDGLATVKVAGAPIKAEISRSSTAPANRKNNNYRGKRPSYDRKRY
ncbi:MAG: DEAD/DEAH box helicase [bacterium]|nr:DEAD/DEAH box helicase [bacterium]